MDILSILLTIALIIIVIIIGAAYFRNANINYRIGKGMFESSENNLDEDKEISDKEYYDGDGGLFK